MYFLCTWTRYLTSLDFDFFFFFFCSLGPYTQHMELPRLGVKSELQLPAYATATATWDLSCVHKLHYSSQQLWILNPLSKARDQIYNVMVPSWICFCCAMTGTPRIFFNLIFILYLGVVDLQCCVTFKCTAKWFSYTYSYIQSPSGSFPI